MGHRFPSAEDSMQLSMTAYIDFQFEHMLWSVQLLWRRNYDMKKLLLLPVCVLVFMYDSSCFFRICWRRAFFWGFLWRNITAIQRQGLLSSIPPLVFYSNEDSSTLDACVQEYRQMLASVVATVDENGTSAEMPLTVCWSGPDVDLSSPGLYQMTGDILAPDGYTFAEGVITPDYCSVSDQICRWGLSDHSDCQSESLRWRYHACTEWYRKLEWGHRRSPLHGYDYVWSYRRWTACLSGSLSLLMIRLWISPFPGEYEIIITLAVSEEKQGYLSASRNIFRKSAYR